MGRDNQPKFRQTRKLERKKATRKSHDRILITSEGSKTEPYYFGEIRQYYRLSTTSIKILPSKFGTSPKQVVDYARHLFENGDSHLGIKPRSYEQVYSVFDRDDHISYHDAINYADKINKINLVNDEGQVIIFKPIVSVPNFELWLLLHYILIHSFGKRSEILTKLKKEIKDYEKGKEGYFTRTHPLLDTAIENSNKLAKKYNPHTGKDPYTDIGHLVQILRELSN